MNDELVFILIICSTFLPAIALLLGYGVDKLREWLLDKSVDNNVVIVYLADASEGTDRRIFWSVATPFVAGFVVYKPIVLLVIGVCVALAFTAREVIRLRTAFDKHVADKSRMNKFVNIHKGD